ncbi:hypothetical protein ACMHYB_50070 [Sorangium sp. So ce1128]
MTKRMAIELGVHGIRVVAVAPTLTETGGMTLRRKDPTADAGMKAYEKNLPSARRAEPARSSPAPLIGPPQPAQARHRSRAVRRRGTPQAVE